MIAKYLLQTTANAVFVLVVGAGVFGIDVPVLEQVVNQGERVAETGTVEHGETNPVEYVFFGQIDAGIVAVGLEPGALQGGL